MAEADSNVPPDTMPGHGKVEQVCRQWLVHEDGEKAHQMQSEEFDMHYGMNRKNRRTVRGDIPIAKIAHCEEEKKQQEERYMHLQQVKAQTAGDEIVAQRIKIELEVQDIRRQKSIEMDDQVIAKQLQEREKKKYEKYLEKKKEKQLQKQREKLEKELAIHTEEAGLMPKSDRGNVQQLGSDMDNMSINPSQRGTTANGHARVTPSGHIEDDGDFTDFYIIPKNGSMDPEEQRFLQEQQDEELARLLQDQEHKRTKAEVDKSKLRDIELQDEKLAWVIQEQEKLKARKAKQRRQHLKEQQRQQMAAGVTTVQSDSPNRSNGQASPSQHHFPYRRDSYTRSITNSAASQESQADAQQTASKQVSSPPSLPPRDPPSYETHRRIQEQNARVLKRPPPSDMAQDDIGEVERWLAGTSPHHVPSSRPQQQHLPPSPSPPGSYRSEDEDGRSFSPDRSAGSGAASGGQFNIAAAIDPTYRRRQHEIQDSDQTEVKSQLPLSTSLPLTDDTELEWDPGLRGSLRRPNTNWNMPHYQESTGTVSTLSRMDEEAGPEGPVLNPWTPVQGQKRSTLDKTRKSKKSTPPLSKKDAKGSCKQQ